MKSRNEANCGRLLCATAVGLVLSAGSGPATAQVAQEQMLKDIIVTASGRDATLQDTPIAITAFDPEQIDRYGIENFDDLAKRTPGLYFSNRTTLTDSNPVIRGVGSPRSASAPSVGVFIDGIDIGNDTFGNVPTFDLERIEVVRGPQSALFGRGVLAGAVNYITRRPSFEGFGANLMGSVAEGGQYVLSGRVEGPLTENFAVSAAIRRTEFDGFFKNTATGKTIGGREALLANASALLKFGSDNRGEAYLRVSHSDEVQEQADWHQVPINSTTPAWYIGKVVFDKTKVANNGDDYAGIDRKFFRASLIVDYDFDFATLTSRSSYSKADFLFDQDFDFTNQPDLPLGASLFGNFRFLSEKDIKDFGQEVRLTGADGGRIEWILGGYYRTEDNKERNFSFTTNSTTPDPVNPNILNRDLETVAVFGSLKGHLTDTLSIAAEMRWAQDTITEVSQPRLAATAQQFSEKFDNVLPRVILEFSPAENYLFYASAAKGNKPGGFNNSPGAGFAPVPDDLKAFDEEIAWSYEVGAKTQLLDRRLTLNASVFYIDWSDIQVNSQVLVSGRPVGFTDNASSADAFGFEVEFSAVPMQFLDIYGGVSYSPIRIQGFVDTRVSRAGITTDGDDQLANTPDWTGNLGAAYRRPITEVWDGFVQADLSYNSTLYASTANLAETGARAIVDLFVGVASDTLKFEVFVNNVLDDKTPNNVAPFVNPTTFARTMIVQAPRPRQLGARVSVNF